MRFVADIFSHSPTSGQFFDISPAASRRIPRQFSLLQTSGDVAFIQPTPMWCTGSLWQHPRLSMAAVCLVPVNVDL